MIRFAVAAALVATPAAAGVKSATPAHFEIELVETVALPPAQVWEVLRAPQRWWNPDHTYSGDASKLYLDSQATGCFCERMGTGQGDRGSVEHMRIVYAQAPRMVRMSGGLGPLQAEAVTGTMTWKVDPEGAGSRITFNYLVAGHMRAGGEALAPLVDQVLGEQLTRLKAAIEAPATPAAG